MTNEEKIDILLKMKKNLLDVKSRSCYWIMSNGHSYICNAFTFATKLPTSKTFKTIPELLKYKPKKLYHGDFWFSVDEEGTRLRVEVIENTINDLKET